MPMTLDQEIRAHIHRLRNPTRWERFRRRVHTSPPPSPRTLFKFTGRPIRQHTSGRWTFVKIRWNDVEPEVVALSLYRNTRPFPSHVSFSLSNSERSSVSLCNASPGPTFSSRTTILSQRMNVRHYCLNRATSCSSPPRLHLCIRPIIRAIPPLSASAKICNVLGGPVTLTLVDDALRDLMDPMKTNLQIWRAPPAELYHRFSPEHREILQRAGVNIPHQLCFTHGDITSHNITFHDGHIVAVIDWMVSRALGIPQGPLQRSSLCPLPSMEG